MVYITKEEDIAILNLSARSTNCLRRAGIHTIGALLEYPTEKFSEIRNSGAKTVEEIQIIIQEIINGSDNFVLVNAQNITSNNSLNSNKEDVIETAFKHDSGFVEGDVLVEKLNIPIRAKNCLIRSGYKYFSQLVGLTIDELMKIKNMGNKTANELFSFVEEHQVSFSIQEKVGTETTSLNELAKEMNLCWGGNINMWLREIVAIKKESPNDSDDTFLFKLYDCEFAHNAIKNYILSVLKDFEEGINRDRLFENIPNNLFNTIVIESILLEMKSSSQIAIENQIIRIKHISVIEFVQNISDERYQKIAQMRLQGQSLQQIGEAIDVTRERVRQLVVKAFAQRPTLHEDKYAYIFQNYYFSKEDFLIAFGETKEAYSYLETVYPAKNSSKKPMEEILSDLSVPLSLRKLAERAIYKDYVTVDNVRLKKQRPVFVKYFIKKYCKNLTEYNYFHEQYHLWLDSLEIADEALLCIDPRTYENHVSLSNYVLWNQGKCFRYYNIPDYDYTELLNTINLEQFDNVELSSLKFFREYPELMYQYDIHDEYELHNLLKKIWPEEKDYVFFKKMPTIEIGVANRDKQVFDLLMQCAPISSEDFAFKYEEIYGVKSATVLANYVDSIDVYFYDGIYNVNSKDLPKVEMDKMHEVLSEDFYLISEVKNLYVQNFPTSNSDNINPYILKKLGFLVYAGNEGYIIRNNYASSASFFNDMLTKNDITDMRAKNSTLCYIGAYQSAMYSLRDNYEIIEFSPLQYINIRRLSALGVSKSDIIDYCFAVASFVMSDDYFTIKSIRQEGFAHKIDALNFEDWFYSSLLTVNKELFSYQRIGGTRIMSKGQNIVTLSKIIGKILKECNEISLSDLLVVLTERFGINLSKDRLAEIVRESDFNYNSNNGIITNV